MSKFVLKLFYIRFSCDIMTKGEVVVTRGILYIIQGFIGAGKSTFSRRLAEETGAEHLNPDEWVGKLFSRNEYIKNWDECFDKTVARLWEKAEALLLDGKDVIFDMGFWMKKDRDFARKIANKCGSKCVHYFLFVPDEILQERIVLSRPPEWAEIHLKNFKKNKSKFEEPTKEENAIIINNY